MTKPTAKQIGKKLQMQLLPSIEGSRQVRLHAHQKSASERDIQAAIIEYLSWCSSIAFVHRLNSGRFKVADQAGTRWIQAGWLGAPDIVAMTTKGQFVAIECKAHSGRTTQEQIEFLQCVRAGGGIGIIARSVDDVINALR